MILEIQVVWDIHMAANLATNTNLNGQMILASTLLPVRFVTARWLVQATLALAMLPRGLLQLFRCVLRAFIHLLEGPPSSAAGFHPVDSPARPDHRLEQPGVADQVDDPIKEFSQDPFALFQDDPIEDVSEATSPIATVSGALPAPSDGVPRMINPLQVLPVLQPIVAPASVVPSPTAPCLSSVTGTSSRLDDPSSHMLVMAEKAELLALARRIHSRLIRSRTSATDDDFDPAYVAATWVTILRYMCSAMQAFEPSDGATAVASSGVAATVVEETATPEDVDLEHWDSAFGQVLCSGDITGSSAEAAPLPLSFVVWLESCILKQMGSVADRLVMGGILVLIWGSLRWSDAQWVSPRDLLEDQDSIRGVARLCVDLYSRDDVHPALQLQRIILAKVGSGFRPVIPLLRGGAPAVSDKPVSIPPVTSLADLHVQTSIEAPSQDDHLDTDSNASSDSAQSEMEPAVTPLVIRQSSGVADCLFLLNEQSGVAHFASDCTEHDIQCMCKVDSDGLTKFFKFACGARRAVGDTCIIPSACIPSNYRMCLRAACSKAFD
eukprot:s465_g8.t1